MSVKDCRMVVGGPANVKTALFFEKEKGIEGSLRGVDRKDSQEKL